MEEATQCRAKTILSAIPLARSRRFSQPGEALAKIGTTMISCSQRVQGREILVDVLDSVSSILRDRRRVEAYRELGKATGEGDPVRSLYPFRTCFKTETIAVLTKTSGKRIHQEEES